MIIRGRLRVRHRTRDLSPREAAAQVGVSRDVVKQGKSRIDRAIAAIE